LGSVVVVVLRISNGYSPDYLLREVATGRENYYTGAVAEGEPPGRWWGAGAEKLGLTGLVDARDMRAVYERFLDPQEDGFYDPSRWDEVYTLGHVGRRYLSEEQLYAAALEREPDASPERRMELRTEAGRNARHNVAFLDVTFSVQKSVTLLHTAFEAQEVEARAAGDEPTAAAWGAYRRAVEDAIWAGNNAGLAYLAEKAGYSRVGHHGGAAGRFVDAHDWVVASFFQHDSRDRDPQLHIHNPVLNRVEGPDGVWRTLDSRGLHKWRPAAAAVAERTTEERLTHALGVRMATRPDGKSREVVGVSPAAMALISTRRRTLTAKADELIAAFEARRGRAPNGLERERLAQQATLLTRRAKSHDGETRTQLLDRVDARIRADICGGLSGVAAAALDARDTAPVAEVWSPQAVIETALADVQQRRAGWTRADLVAAINAALPDYLGIPDGSDVGGLLDQLTDEALRYATPLDAPRPGDEHLPKHLRLANGESAHQAPGARLYATPAQVRTERALVTGSCMGGVRAMPPEAADRFLRQLAASGVELGADQAAAVRGILTSGARVESLVGPAGTGKSFVIGTLTRAWSHHAVDSHTPAGRVFGLATSQVATEVLAGEGLTARNAARWLATQDRLAQNGAFGDDAEWRLGSGDLVVVDESAMTDTAALARIHDLVMASGAKLVLVGDHKQLAAVGAGGGMELLATAGARYELAEARRFTRPWERQASLRLRAGDTAVLGDYHRHGRLRDAGTVEQAEASAAAAWLGDTLAGRRSLLLVDTNEQAARLSAQLRAELVRLGRVRESGVLLGLQGTYAGVGDLVQARRNGWDLIGHAGNRRGPINRETLRVTAVRDDGALEVATLVGRGRDGVGERMVLPPAYVGEHLALGYATTVHAAQGVTVDTSHSVITPGTGPASLYVGLTRGRDANTAHVATITGADDPAQGGEHHRLHRDPVAVLAGILDAPETPATKSALALAAESIDDATSVRAAAELLADAAHLAATERTAAWLDQLTDHGVLSGSQRARLAAEDGAANLTRILRRAELAGHDPHRVLHEAIADRPLDGVRSLSNVIYSRIRDAHRFDPVGQAWTGWVPHTDNAEWNRYLGALATAADERTRRLGRETAQQQPGWAVEALGPVPADAGAARTEWEQRAGLVAAYRELRGHDDPSEALGPAPQPGQVEAYAAYRAAWRTLGRPEIEREELELSDGQLRIRVRAYQREAAWAPRYVGNELAGTHQAAAHHHRHLAALRTAEAAATDHPDQRARLHAEAAQAGALAELLDQRAAQLHALDDARSHWLVHTAATRAAADRAKAELAARHTDDPAPEQHITAQEWLDAHRAAQAEEERHRVVTESDVIDRPDDLDDAAARGREDTAYRRNELAEDRPAHHAMAQNRLRPVGADLREMAAAEPAQRGEDVVRVPTADQTADAINRANRALAEISAREALDAQEAVEYRNAQLARWHAQDELALEHDDAADWEAPTLDRTSPR
jgi:conjugative relaxase-like TrwC/TraI family protein